MMPLKCSEMIDKEQKMTPSPTEKMIAPKKTPGPVSKKNLRLTPPKEGMKAANKTDEVSTHRRESQIWIWF
jgi:hypothetical protein